MKLIALLLLAPTISMAGLKYPSERLKVMDIETLQRIVATHTNNAQRAIGTFDPASEDYIEEGATNEYTREEGAQFLKQSLELIFARPEQNKATSVIYSSVEGIAVQYGGIYQFLKEITDNAIDTLDQSGNDKALLRDQNTYVYILNNLMAEIKPLAATPAGVKYKELIEKIRDEDISFSDSLKSYRVLNSMSNILNPSEVAEKIVGKKKCSWYAFWC